MRSPGDGREILRCAQNDRDGENALRGTGGAEPRPYGSILVRKKTRGRFVNRPYGVDGKAAVKLRGVEDAAPYGP